MLSEANIKLSSSGAVVTVCFCVNKLLRSSVYD